MEREGGGKQGMENGTERSVPWVSQVRTRVEGKTEKRAGSKGDGGVE